MWKCQNFLSSLAPIARICIHFLNVSVLLVYCRVYTEWPIKMELHTSKIIGMQYLVSVYEVTSPEKNDTKIPGSVVCFLENVLWSNVEASNFPFSA